MQGRIIIAMSVLEPALSPLGFHFSLLVSAPLFFSSLILQNHSEIDQWVKTSACAWLVYTKILPKWADTNLPSNHKLDDTATHIMIPAAYALEILRRFAPREDQRGKRTGRKMVEVHADSGWRGGARGCCVCGCGGTRRAWYARRPALFVLRIHDQPWFIHRQIQRPSPCVQRFSYHSFIYI
jgi:hypothetical protein